MAGILDHIYAHSPIWFQNIGISLYGLIWQNRRFGGNFQNYLLGYRNREKFTAEEWKNYQTGQLRAILEYASLNVPYYREFFKNIGLHNFQQFTLGDLHKIPLLEKEAIRQDPHAFISQEKSTPKLFPYHTSGTTGTPITILFSKDMHRNWSAAYDVRVRGWAGVNHKMSRAMIGGRLVVPKANSKPPFWRYNRVERQLYMSAFHISPQNALHYVSALNHYQPDYLVGYASSHFFLAKFILQQGLKVIQPKAILTSSEKLTSEMRDIIQKAFRSNVYDAYSGLEACSLISECEYQNLHISPDVGIIELVGKNGDLVAPGEPGEIVSTGLLNFDQPLIRYKTGDWVVLSTTKCQCGRQMPVVEEIFGRQEDVITLKDGKMIASFYKVFQGIKGIKESQVIQQDYDKFDIFLVIDDNFTSIQQQKLLNNILSRYGQVKIQIIIVDNIEKTDRGKFRSVISKIKSN